MLSRIGRELKLALQFMTTAPKASLSQQYKKATNQLHQAVKRETAALMSAATLGDDGGPLGAARAAMIAK